MDLSPATNLQRKLVDEYGELDRKVTEFAPTKRRHEEVAKTIRGWYENAPADKSDVVEGAKYSIQVGARGEERHFSPKSRAAIFKQLGAKVAFKFFGITLKAATEALGEGRVAELTHFERTGSRKLVAVAKQPAVSASNLKKAA